MNIRMRIAVLAIAGVGALGLGVMSAGSALAGSGPVTAVTHASQHPDTTNASGPACGSSGNGPTWAADNIARQFRVTGDVSQGYTVTITDHGSFAGFADPANCQPLTSNGPIQGTYTVHVQATQGPDPSKLAAQYAGEVSTSQMISDLFGGNTTSITGGPYSYSYQNGNYVQSFDGSTSTITGDVIGH
jgi:hypothetical protein